MRHLSRLVLLIFSASAAAQEPPSTLQELLEAVQRGTVQPPACKVEIDSTSEVLSPTECDNGEHVCIRVHNATAIDFDTFRIRFPSQSQEFGPIEADVTTAYRRIGCAYWYNYTEATSDGRRYVRPIIDHTGDAFVVPGKYTLHFQVRELNSPASGDGWTLHGHLGEVVEFEEDTP